MAKAPILPASPAAYERGGALLRQGRLVAFPTETVYGLGADATNDTAVTAVFAVKERPEFNPLIIHVASPEAAEKLAEFPDLARRLAAAFWPGPLTLVLPRRGDCPVSHLATAGLDTLALRVPGHPVAASLLQAADRPVAAPSANRSGRVSPTTAQHVAAELGNAVDLIIDGGPSTVGIESTILAVEAETIRLLRPGGVAVEAIEMAAGCAVIRDSGPARPEAPGQLKSHYAPSVPVRLEATTVERNEALLAFGPPLAGAARTLNLSEDGDLTEAASHLFAMLRDLDDPRFRAIAVMPIPETGLGLAINDRLRRAAAAREGQ